MNDTPILSRRRFLRTASHAATVLAAVLAIAQSSAQSPTYLSTRKIEHVDDYHGTKVADPYRWLEDDNAEDTKAWVQAENAVTFGYLDKIPFRPKIKARLTEIFNYPRYSSPFRRRAGRGCYFPTPRQRRWSSWPP